MARSVVTPTQGVFNTAVAVVGDAIDLTNDHSISMSGFVTEKIGVLIVNSSTVAGTFTFKAGDFSESSQGDYDAVLPASGSVLVTLESARFLDEDGLLLIDGASTGATTGTIYAVAVP